MFFLICVLVPISISANITISPIYPDRWPEYKALRLAALADDPSALAVAMEDEANKSDGYWKDRLIQAQQKKNFWILFAQEENELVGMVGAVQEYGDYSYCRHLVTITGMYVKPNRRGKGIGAELMQALITELQQASEAQIAMLWVTKDKPALNLYKKCGFKQVGILEDSVMINGQYFDSILMQRYL